MALPAASSLSSAASQPSWLWLTSRRQIYAGAALIVVLTVIVYYVSLRGNFIMDDDLLLTKSSLIKAPDGLYRFWFTNQAVDYWPITNTTFWIEWRLWGENATGYRATNLALHIIDVLLLWAVLSKLAIPGSFWAALLFAVHPVNVESVAWISQRKNLLALLFGLLSVWCWLRGEEGGATNVERQRVDNLQSSAHRPIWNQWYLLSTFAFLAAMLSKGSVATLPLILLLIGWWQIGRITKRTWIRTIPFFLIAVGLTIVNLWFRTHGENISIRHIDWIQRLLGASAGVWFYLGKALMPVNLSFIYPRWDIRENDLRWWLPLVALVATTAILFWKRQTTGGRALLFAWVFFGLALAPSLGFVDVGFMKFTSVADHYQHIALIAVTAIVVAGFLIGRRRFANISVLTMNALLAGVILACALLSLRRASLISDAENLYNVTLEANPTSGLCHYLLGKIMLDRADNHAAYEHFLAAIHFDPENAKAHNNLGVTLYNDGKLTDAMAQYKEALWLNNTYAEAEYNLAVALTDAGRVDEAMADFRKAIEMKPDLFQAHVNLAALYADRGNLSEAIGEVEQGLELAQAAQQQEFVVVIDKTLQSYRSKLSRAPEKSPVPKTLPK